MKWGTPPLVSHTITKQKNTGAECEFTEADWWRFSFCCGSVLKGPKTMHFENFPAAVPILMIDMRRQHAQQSS
jgi:hypothetical protein